MIIVLVKKCFKMANRLLKGEVNLKDFFLDGFSHLINLSKPQRWLRRKLFPIEQVICSELTTDNEKSMSEFLYESYAFFRRKNDALSVKALQSSCEANNENLVYIAKYKNKIIARVVLIYRGLSAGVTFWEVAGLSVLKKFQGCGIGEKLMQKILTVDKVVSRTLFLSVENSNFRAVNLYEKLGFQRGEKLERRLGESYYLNKAAVGLLIMHKFQNNQELRKKVFFKKRNFPSSFNVGLKIADTFISLKSHFPLEGLSREERKLLASNRYKNFLSRKEGKPDITIDVNIVEKLPLSSKANTVFVTNHFQDGKENWRLLKKGKCFIYQSLIEKKTQMMIINNTFDKVDAFLLSKSLKGRVWNPADIIYDFLQVLLLNFLAQRKKGILAHSVGLKDIDGKGFLFVGKSGSGKSTTAKLWHRHSQARVLNDDRIIVSRNNGEFFINSSPWHGEFSDYLNLNLDPAPLKKIFFIYHEKDNVIKEISDIDAFNLLYTSIFPNFWDKNSVENIASFSLDFLRRVNCYSLGFVNDSKIIEFVREMS